MPGEPKFQGGKDPVSTRALTRLTSNIYNFLFFNLYMFFSTFFLTFFLSLSFHTTLTWYFVWRRNLFCSIHPQTSSLKAFVLGFASFSLRHYFPTHQFLYSIHNTYLCIYILYVLYIYNIYIYKSSSLTEYWLLLLRAKSFGRPFVERLSSNQRHVSRSESI